MTTLKFTESELSPLKIASLPTRPTAPAAYGGRGYSAADMKAAFDKLPLFIAARLNSLIDDLTSEGEGSAAASMPTGIKEGHTLAALFSDLTSGELATYLAIDGTSLLEYKLYIERVFEEHTDKFDLIERYMADGIIDGGSPSDREEAANE